jgi:hypothetical protein
LVPPQVIPKQELDSLLAGRVKFHAQHREVLKTALKTYLNGGVPVPEGAGGGAAAVVVNWDDTLDEEAEVDQPPPA